jgi:LysR family hydrogen peroxide-inducible transcriptional activator
VSPSENIRLLAFSDPPPTRRMAMVWRKTSAMGDFLHALAAVLRDLPPGLLDPPKEVLS